MELFYSFGYKHRQMHAHTRHRQGWPQTCGPSAKWGCNACCSRAGRTRFFLYSVSVDLRKVIFIFHLVLCSLEHKDTSGSIQTLTEVHVPDPGPQPTLPCAKNPTRSEGWQQSLGMGTGGWGPVPGNHGEAGLHMSLGYMPHAPQDFTYIHKFKGKVIRISRLWSQSI